MRRVASRMDFVVVALAEADAGEPQEDFEAVIAEHLRILGLDDVAVCVCFVFRIAVFLFR